MEKEFKGIEVAKLEGLCGHSVLPERSAETEKAVGEWVEKQVAKGWTWRRGGPHEIEQLYN